MNDSQKIEELLHHFRMEQKDFAEKCDFDPTIISHIKNGKIGISKRVFNKIITTFPEVNKEWLLSGEGNMFQHSINQTIIEGNNVQTGTNIVGNNIENCQNIGNNNDVTNIMSTLLAEKDERIKEKDERIKEKDERIKEKDERIRELMNEKEELKQIIKDLKTT